MVTLKPGDLLVTKSMVLLRDHTNNDVEQTRRGDLLLCLGEAEACGVESILVLWYGLGPFYVWRRVAQELTTRLLREDEPG